MQFTDIQNPNERKKLIGAGVLGMLAIALLWWTFVGFGSGVKVSPTTGSDQKSSVGSRSASTKGQPQSVGEVREDLLDQLRPVNFEYSLPYAQEPKRNIFVYYEPPKPVVIVPTPPTPTPTPTPPVLLAGVSPSNVFARTGDFKLEISGDKFTPQLKVLIDNNEVPTRYISPQQLSATVAAVIIGNPGMRQVTLRSSDGTLYSNSAALTVAPAPIPNYNYVGIFGTPRHIDTAIVQDKASKEILNIQRGDLLGGRFRVTSISEKELILVDNNLKIKHTLAFSNQGERGNPLQRPTPRAEGEDDEL
jgi:IPT/TIG domain-containing protein